MTGRLRQLSEPRLRQQAGIEKSQTPVERDILIQWVRINTQEDKPFSKVKLESVCKRISGFQQYVTECTVAFMILSTFIKGLADIGW